MLQYETGLADALHAALTSQMHVERLFYYFRLHMAGRSSKMQQHVEGGVFNATNF